MEQLPKTDVVLTTDNIVYLIIFMFIWRSEAQLLSAYCGGFIIVVF